MFERYTEKARRVIFFALDGARSFGSSFIETEHLLLGVLRESGATLNRYLEQMISEEELRTMLKKNAPARETIPPHIDVPLSNECKRILAYSAEEAERLGHRHIGTEHMMLGIMREQNCLAAKLLHERGLELKKARQAVAKSAQEGLQRGEIRLETGTTLPSYPMRAIQFVDADTAEPILICQNLSPLPKAGERILIHDQDGGPTLSYRVQDVIWEFQRNAGASLSHEVKVRLLKQEDV